MLARAFGRTRQHHRTCRDRGAGPLTIRASELLGLDADLREKWKEFIAQLAPYPMGDEPEASRSLAESKPPTLGGQHGKGDVAAATTARTYGRSDLPLRTRHLGTSDSELRAVAWRTHRHFSTRAVPGIAIPSARHGSGTWSGSAQLVFALCHSESSGFQDVRGAEDYASIEALSLTSARCRTGCCKPFRRKPGEPEVLIVFPTWPTGLERLLPAGWPVRVLVASTIQEDKVGFVEIESRCGEPAAWPPVEDCLPVDRGWRWLNAKISGELLEFATRKGVRIRPAPRPGTAADGAHRGAGANRTGHVAFRGEAGRWRISRTPGKPRVPFATRSHRC